MRCVLGAVCLLTVALSGGAAAQTGKECTILKRALYGDSVVDGNRSLSDASVPEDLRWPVPGGGRPNLSVGKGSYSFYVEFSDATKAKQLFEALDKQVAQCLTSIKRVANADAAWMRTYCPQNTAKIVSVMTGASARFVQVLLSINTVTNRAQSCR